MKLFSAVFFFLLSITAFSQYNKREYSALKLEEQPPTIDGIFDELVWRQASWESDFVQVTPYEGREPCFQTEFAIVYDKNNLYVAIKALDNGRDSISVRMTRRDETEGDGVGIILDTYNDKRTGFAFSVSAAGIKSDFIFSEDAVYRDDTWDPIWWVKTKVTELGWNAEILIPLTQLRFEEGEEQTWGMQVNRYIFRKDESSSWQPIKREYAGYISKFGTLKGIENIQPKNSLNITPYVVQKFERFKKEPDNPFLRSGKNSDMDAGLDAKIGLTNYLTLDLTVNPDFGQVEADPSRVNLSSYETFFEEKRPFFVEGKNILKYQLSFGNNEWNTEGLFYSRRIGKKPVLSPELNENEYSETPEFTRILGAAKISGKTKNGWSVGILESITAKENATILSNENNRLFAVEPLTNYLVGRIQKDFNNGNTYFGGIFTAVNRNTDDAHLNFLHKSAFSGGIDYVHKWNNKKWSAEGGFYVSTVNGSKEALSRTQTSWIRNFQRPDIDYVKFDSSRTSLTGHGGKLSISELEGKWKFGGQFAWRSPGLELNDVGFAQQIDQITQVVWVAYQIYEPVSIFRSIFLNLAEYGQWDFGLNRNALNSNFTANAQFTNFWNANTFISYNSEGFANSALRGGPSLKIPGSTNANFTLSTNPQKKLVFYLNAGGTWSHAVDFSTNQNAGLTIGYRPFKALKLDITPGMYLSERELQYVSQLNYGENKRYIFAHIVQNTLNTSFRFNFNITPDLTIQYWGQPFIATGEYSRFKYITNSKADVLSDRYKIYESGQISYIQDWGSYRIDENLDGTVDYSFNNPDFNTKSFLSNMVLRWEYEPGSTIFLVWSQSRNSYKNDGNFSFKDDITTLFNVKAHNIFLLKLSYRIGR